MMALQQAGGLHQVEEPTTPAWQVEMMQSTMMRPLLPTYT